MLPTPLTGVPCLRLGPRRAVLDGGLFERLIEVIGSEVEGHDEPSGRLSFCCTTFYL